MEVGKRISELRERKDISTNKLADKAGVSQSYLRQVEIGSTSPTIEKLSYIVEALGVSLQEFFSLNTDKEDLVSLINRLNKEEKESVYNLLKAILDVKNTK